MTIKRFAGVFFVIAFLFSLRVYFQLGWNYISASTATYGFIISGAIGLFLNLLSFKHNNKNIGFNFTYWLGSILVFVGLLLRFMHYPFAQETLIGGMIVLGASFFIPSSWLKGKTKKNTDLLDDL